MPVVSRSFESHASNNTIWLGSTPILWDNTLGGVRGLPPLFPFYQPHERTCGSMAIQSTHMPQRHYTFTNIHAFSGIRTQALQHRSQLH
ncbi:hypothetical protein TNCV_4039351 [Trichonephila clavipes]|nr:hypothetical protein TNCV_4039351 [Trichonephila clavipes]